MQTTLAQIRAALQQTPATIDSLVAGIPGGLETWREGPAAWNCLEVLAHLADGEITDWMPRVETIVSGGGRFPPFDREGGFERYRGWGAGPLVAEFRRLRQANLVRLAELRLEPAALDRTGEHPEFGRVTLGQLLATWATHDMAHVAQLARILTRGFGRDVGPWAAYFSLLGGRSGT